MVEGKVTAEGYLVLVPEANERYVWGIRIARYRRSRPALAAGEIAVKVRLHFQKQALLDAVPSIELDVQSFLSPSTPAAPESAEVSV